MKPRVSQQKTAALTGMEVLVSIVVLFVLASLAIAISNSHQRHDWRSKLTCEINLRQVGVEFRSWEIDYNDKYPMQVSVTNGGAMELAATGNVTAVFQVMSNELGTPKIVVCPQDMDRDFAVNFTTDFNNSRVSYFVNADGDADNPQTLLCGDSNFEVTSVRVKSGLLRLSSSAPPSWTAARHGFSGYLLFGDGSVQRMNNADLSNYFDAGQWTNRLAIP